MVEQVREGQACESYRQIVHMGKVRLTKPARLMDLLKDDVTGWTLLGTPGGNMPLEGAELDGLVATGMQQTELVKQGLSLERRVTPHLRLYPWPSCLKRIGACAATRLLDLAG